jgi:hypothetical protein
VRHALRNSLPNDSFASGPPCGDERHVAARPGVERGLQQGQDWERDRNGCAWVARPNNVML